MQMWKLKLGCYIVKCYIVTLYYYIVILLHVGSTVTVVVWEWDICGKVWQENYGRKLK